jgi:hypothetical protein
MSAASKLWLEQAKISLQQVGPIEMSSCRSISAIRYLDDPKKVLVLA